MLGRKAVFRFVHAGALSLVLIGCESHMLPFQPVNASHTAGIEQPVIRYDLRVGSSAIGSAILWSEGASEEGDGPRIFDVELVIHNATKSPILFDAEGSRVAASTHEGRRAILSGPVGFNGSKAIAPNSTGRLGIRFALPRGLTASDVAEFEFDWRVESPSGVYEQSTLFAAVGATDADGHLVTCVGANGFNTSNDCKDPNTVINH